MRRDALKTFACVSLFTVCLLQASTYYDHLDTDNLFALISSLGFSLAVIFFPYGIILLCDTCGWLMTFGPVRSSISFTKLFSIRIATETLQASLPGGAVYAELIRPYLLKKHLTLEYSQSISSNIITKTNILLAQVMFLLLGLLLLMDQSTNAGLVGSSPIVQVGVIAAVFFPLLFAYLLYRKNLLLWIVCQLRRSKMNFADRLLEKWREPLTNINRAVFSFACCHKLRLMSSTVVFLISWLLMSLETLIILRVMGAHATFSQAIVIESLISIVRVAFFFIPGAIGPQDVSLLVLFSLAGIPDPLTNSVLFVLLKRSKELLWILAGYILLFVLGIRLRNLLPVRRVGTVDTSALYATSEAS